MLDAGELLHIVTRRMFDDEVRRHFVGEVESADGAIVRLRGYAFIFDGMRGEFVRRPELRTRLVGLADACNIINVLPEDLVLDDLTYVMTGDRRLVLSDGKDFELDINEFGPNR